MVALLASPLAAAPPFMSSQPDTLPPDYPRSLERELQVLLDAEAHHSSDVTRLITLADIYRNTGDDLHTDAAQRHLAYDEGARLAARALALQETNAEAHFLYAANLGSAARLKGRVAASLAVREIKRHVARAIELQPDHPQALQFMGGLLAALPWALGGDTAQAQQYLERAVALDGNFTNARILLAKLYIRQGRREAAAHQLRAVIQADRPHYPYTWARQFRPEAERLLQTLGATVP